jgi:UDP-3-O-[3-hydroxymyristoyl] glucosamine N-acyltransferase
MDGASIGDGTVICPNAVIQSGAVIGSDCRIGANVTIRERCILGDRVIIQPGAVIGSDGYGYEFLNGKHVKIDQVGIVEIGDDVEIGANTTVDRARFGKTLIGEGTKIDNLVQIGHNVIIGKHCLIIAQTGIAGSSKLEDYVTVAAQAGVVGHVTIGSKAILAARTGATTSLAGGITYAGMPALPISEENKLKAHVRRLPKLLARLKALEAIAIKKTDSSSS